MSARDESKLQLAKRRAVHRVVCSLVGLGLEALSIAYATLRNPGLAIVLVFIILWGSALILLILGAILGFAAGKTLSPADRPHYLIARASMIGLALGVIAFLYRVAVNS